MKHTKPRDSAWAILLIFLRLGLTSFGGPIAHLGYFREAFVRQRAWLSEAAYADLVALCQFLPGPASSQVGMGLGFMRAGYAGALAAWVGFTMPSAACLIGLAMGMMAFGQFSGNVVHGLKIVAVAVVAQAVWGMGRSLCTDGRRVSIMVGAATWVLLMPGAFAQVGVIMIAALLGLLLFPPPTAVLQDELNIELSPRMGVTWLILFFILLAALPVLAVAMPGQTLAEIDAFYRAGALVFGGGHVVLPLLQASVVGPGWVSSDTFLAGYGAAQAVPGPLFTFAAFLGASLDGPAGGWHGGLICLLAIFAPSFLLVAGALPFWHRLRRSPRAQKALSGVNAAVVGLLLAALYHPVWTSAILRPADFALALLAFVALMFWKWPTWIVVGSCFAMGWVI